MGGSGQLERNRALLKVRGSLGPEQKCISKDYLLLEDSLRTLPPVM